MYADINFAQFNYRTYRLLYVGQKVSLRCSA